MKKKKKVRKDDQEAVLREVGGLIPILLREGVDDGFHSYAMSRRKDKGAYPDYSACTRANMLYDRIMSSVRQLVDAAARDNPDLVWKITHNKRATDVLLDERFAFRIKRTKKNRRGCTTSVLTTRQRLIKSRILLPIGQMVLPFSNGHLAIADVDRIWLTVGFDLDEAEESIDKVFLGIELRRRFLWKVLLAVPEAKVIAKLSPALADKIKELRVRRSA